jgi:hypothetical protein
MLADTITGNISPEATAQAGNIFADATRGSETFRHGNQHNLLVGDNQAETSGAIIGFLRLGCSIRQTPPYPAPMVMCANPAAAIGDIAQPYRLPPKYVETAR